MTRHEAKVPTEDEATALSSSFGVFLEQLQMRALEVKRLLEAHDKRTAPPPTFADLGRLYSLIENLKVDQWGFGEEVKDLEECLHKLYIAKDEGDDA